METKPNMVWCKSDSHFLPIFGIQSEVSSLPERVGLKASLADDFPAFARLKPHPAAFG